MHAHAKEFNMNKTVIISGHPRLNTESLNNKIIVDKVRELENVEVRDLKSLYPDFRIDVEAEQAVLLKADNVVFQFPFYWYTVPGILKEWIDEVFTYGFAYGSTGDKLKGKRLIISMTIGGPEESYSADGYNTYTIDELTKQFKQIANLTGMSFELIHTHNMIYIPDIYNVKEEVEQRAHAHADRLISVIS